MSLSVPGFVMEDRREEVLCGYEDSLAHSPSLSLSLAPSLTYSNAHIHDTIKTFFLNHVLLYLNHKVCFFLNAMR